jgi:hypothetical protein
MQPRVSINKGVDMTIKMEHKKNQLASKINEAIEANHRMDKPITTQPPPTPRLDEDGNLPVTLTLHQHTRKE